MWILHSGPRNMDDFRFLGQTDYSGRYIIIYCFVWVCLANCTAEKKKVLYRKITSFEKILFHRYHHEEIRLKKYISTASPPPFHVWGGTNKNKKNYFVFFKFVIRLLIAEVIKLGQTRMERRFGWTYCDLFNFLLI